MLITLRLRFHGDLLDPTAVTDLLKVTPNLAVAKGSVKSISNGAEIVEKTSRWEWYSEDISNLLSVDDHISRLGAQFFDVLSELRQIPNCEYAWIDLSMIHMSKSADSNISFLLNTTSVSIIGKIGIPLELSYYVLTEDAADVS
ncbi:DUF4279 domain-containing protein [Massilia sp. PWRC2]|uniref:DUF4279 domain-containing protein n=1 Tax=Massilia sp. PWRC2 TaxID=2804626 RepID=UPI003CE86281